MKNDATSDSESRFQKNLMQLWNSTRSFYYILPRQMIQCCLLSLLYANQREIWNSYCSEIEAVLGALSPATIQLFFISFFTHFLAFCVEAPLTKNSVIFSIPKMDNVNGTLSVMDELTKSKHFQRQLFSNVVCLLMGTWLQNIKILPQYDAHTVGYNSVEEMHKHVLMNFQYLLGTSLSDASTSSISSLLLHFSLLSQSFDLMAEMLMMLPANYFNRHFRTIITYVSRMVISCELDSPTHTASSEKEMTESIHSHHSSLDSQTLKGPSVTLNLARSVVASTNSQSSRGISVSVYEERKNTVLILLRRMNTLEMNEHGDMELLNSLWKLLNLCYYRDYFVFIREFLPFVILHYSVALRNMIDV